MARTITHIPARQEISNRAAAEVRQIRVAAYCRVSTDQEEQLNSFTNQVSYYTSYIQNTPRYTMAGIYADEGITGTSTRRREQFKKMIEDCKGGKIDLIITKSISRFARNTQDCLQYSRLLKSMGIGIFFEKENINTLDATGELLFTILSSLAQDESRSISENCKWGIRKKFKNGVLHLNANRFMGYDKNEKGHLVINPKQAVIVKRVFDEFMGGLNPDVIASRLQREGVPGCMGEPKWHTSTIQGMLRNEKYMGDALLQKTYTQDYLTKKTVKNNGELEQVRVKGDHEPIVDAEMWEAVQLELDRRSQYMERYGLRTMGRYTDEQPFSCKVICGTCNNLFWRRTWYRSNGTVKVWQCGQRYREKGVVGCTSENLTEKDLHQAFITAWNGILENREDLMDTWKEQMEHGNPLERYRAEMFIGLTKGTTPLKEIDLALVGKTLEHITVEDTGVLNFFFLDGTELGITREE